MTQPISPIETAFLEVRSSDLSLKDRLSVVADAARTHKPWYADAVDSFAARLRDVQAGAGSLPSTRSLIGARPSSPFTAATGALFVGSA